MYCIWEIIGEASCQEANVNIWDWATGPLFSPWKNVNFQYKLKESPIPSDEEESSEESSDDEFGPKKPKVDPDDPVARKSSQKKVWKRKTLKRKNETD